MSKQREPLTPREKQVLELLFLGLRGKEVATQLHIETKTVEAHRFKIYKKLAVSNVVQAYVLMRNEPIRFAPITTADSVILELLKIKARIDATIRGLRGIESTDGRGQVRGGLLQTHNEEKCAERQPL